MSSLTGHAKLTAAAVRELRHETAPNFLTQGYAEVALPAATVARDVYDFLNTGHWADFGQKHHFMRKFDSQSPYQAYEAAVEWIRSNALTSAKALAARLPRGGSSAPASIREVFSGINWQPLGNAVHALEDSFAAGHVVRGASAGAGSPGPIEGVKRYAGAEMEGHKEGDDAWEDARGGFSASGRLAIGAVKALLRVVMATAQAGPSPATLAGWQGFREKWLKAGESLSHDKDRVFELIDRYTTSLRHGATNLKTLNMDEEGLAKALLAETPATTLAVFVRLDAQYNSDADDVAEIYVRLVRHQGGAKVAALKANKPLVTRLIKVLHEGWTTGGEKKCIEFLKTL